MSWMLPLPVRIPLDQSWTSITPTPLVVVLIAGPAMQSPYELTPSLPTTSPGPTIVHRLSEHWTTECDTCGSDEIPWMRCPFSSRVAPSPSVTAGVGLVHTRSLVRVPTSCGGIETPHVSIEIASADGLQA